MNNKLLNETSSFAHTYLLSLGRLRGVLLFLDACLWLLGTFGCTLTSSRSNSLGKTRAKSLENRCARERSREQEEDSHSFQELVPSSLAVAGEDRCSLRCRHVELPLELPLESRLESRLELRLELLLYCSSPMPWLEVSRFYCVVLLCSVAGCRV